MKTKRSMILMCACGLAAAAILGAYHRPTTIRAASIPTASTTVPSTPSVDPMKTAFDQAVLSGELRAYNQVVSQHMTGKQIAYRVASIKASLTK